MPDAKVDKPESVPGKKTRRRILRWVRRGLLTFLALAVLLVLLGWIFLPRIAEHVIRSMVADAGLEQSDLRVAEVGWNHAVIEDVDVGGSRWRLRADRVDVSYGVSDLLGGKLDGVELVGGSLVVDLSTGDVESPAGVESGAGTGNGADPSQPMDQLLTRHLKQLGELKADDFLIKFHRGGESMVRRVTVEACGNRRYHPTVGVFSDAFSLSVQRRSGPGTPAWATNVTVDDPLSFMAFVEFMVGADGPWLPEGMTVGRAFLTHSVNVGATTPWPVEVTGNLEQVRYDGGEKPVRVGCEDALVILHVREDGNGVVEFSGVFDSLSLPLDPSAGFELGLEKNVMPKWKASIAWDAGDVELSGSFSGLDLAGKYDGKPVELEGMRAGFSLVQGKLEVSGGFSNGGTAVPFKYAHALEDLPDAQWLLGGDVQLGPVVHKQPLPLLNAVTDLFEDLRIEGESHTRIAFTLGSREPFRGTMTTEIRDAKVDVADGKLLAEGVNGKCELHLVPLADASPGAGDPSYYTLGFSAGKLTVASRDALDYDLVHASENPVVLSGKGKLGEIATLAGEVKGLDLRGEKDGNEITLADTSLAYRLIGGVLHAEGKTHLGGNGIPFTYRHDRKSSADAWDLAGFLKIDDAHIGNPLGNAVMLVEAMEGKTIAGKLSMKMDFTIGSEADFDGVLVASLTDGILTMEDGGPVLEGLRGDIRLASMKEKKTDGFHRVTARKVKAFDTEMTNLRLDYRILPNGDIPLKNIALSALGGVVWLDPFVLPGGDDNYQFKLRMKRIDLARLAKLFPDFDGSISGRIDGLLPMQNIAGEFRPVRGGMYLTPRSRARLRYNAGNKFSAGLDPKSQEYKKMKMVEDSLKNLDLQVLSIRMFDPRDGDKAVVLRLRGQAPTVPGSPPIILNINGFKPDDKTVDFFDLLLRHRDKLNFGL